mgnify:CR=1 FL=1
MKFVAYYRVSTVRQGQSGLGLEAQRAAVSSYVLGKCGKVAAEFVEIESGKRNDRPELARAITEARRQGAMLVISTLDRLGRDVHLISGLMKATDTNFVVADDPHAGPLMLHIKAAIAEEEGRKISERTRAALAAAKARGVKLGWAMPSRHSEQRQAAQKGAAIRKAKADEFSANVLPIVRELQGEGMSLRRIAATLNERGVKTARGGIWAATTVRNILARDSRAEGIAAE